MGINQYPILGRDGNKAVSLEGTVLAKERKQGNVADENEMKEMLMRMR